MSKPARHTAIRDLVAAKAIPNQEELRRLLAKRGWEVTQSTLSRDLSELRLVRIRDDKGELRYAFPDNNSIEDASRQLKSLLPQLLTGVEGVQALVVARTLSSGAQPVAAALDHATWPEIAGTIAGDDTVLIVCRSPAGRGRVVRRLRAYIAGAQ